MTTTPAGCSRRSTGDDAQHPTAFDSDEAQRARSADLPVGGARLGLLAGVERVEEAPLARAEQRVVLLVAGLRARDGANGLKGRHGFGLHGSSCFGPTE